MGGYVRYNELYRRTWSLDGALLYDSFLFENNAIMMHEPFLPEGRK